MISVEDIRRREFRVGKSPGPASFCTVIDSNALWEGLFCLYTIRKFHDQPIYVICDKEAEEHIKVSGIEGVRSRASIDSESNDDIDSDFNGGFNSYNEKWDHYHPIAILFRKPDAMAFAMEENENALFLDCDVYYMEPFTVEIDSEVGLYPSHVNFGYDDDHRLNMEKKFGVATAGYVYSSRKDFPEWWRDAIKNDSDYYDQECLSRAEKKYTVKFFPASHHLISNHFDFMWPDYMDYDRLVDRFPEDNMKDLGWNFMDGLITHLGRTVSFHFHIDPGCVLRRGQVLDSRARMIGRIFLTALEKSSREEHVDILKFFCDRIRPHTTPIPDDDSVVSLKGGEDHGVFLVQEESYA